MIKIYYISTPSQAIRDQQIDITQLYYRVNNLIIYILLEGMKIHNQSRICK